MSLPSLPRPRLSYANVTSTLALVIALSTGGAYAAATIGSKQIKDDAVKSRHLAAGAVTTPDLRDGAAGWSKLGADVAAPRASGVVAYTGTTVYGGRNLSAANVVRGAAGIYCFHDLGFTPTMAVANSALAPNAFHHDVEIYGITNNWGNASPCPPDSQLQIRVYAPGTTTAQDGNFSVAIF